jgi:hypothetical protein
MTTRSPDVVGMVEMRTSTSDSPRRSVARPSCGRRRSAMSILPMTLMRLMTASWYFLGGASMSYSTPSMR